ncbi:hypothetical protein [Haloplanus salilacus]|uniref:hypothetical protein n=1 Tax=Haloplanus salilacus TaxID=2949994 RepID=UPI0030D61CE8
MTRRNGEVAVKRDGHVHAVAAPELSGPINVDVDALLLRKRGGWGTRLEEVPE